MKGEDERARDECARAVTCVWCAKGVWKKEWGECRRCARGSVQEVCKGERVRRVCKARKAEAACKARARGERERGARGKRATGVRGGRCARHTLHTARFAHGALCTRHALHAALTGADEELVGDPGVIDVVDGGSEEGGQNLQV